MSTRLLPVLAVLAALVSTLGAGCTTTAGDGAYGTVGCGLRIPLLAPHRTITQGSANCPVGVLRIAFVPELQALPRQQILARLFATSRSPDGLALTVVAADTRASVACEMRGAS